MNPRTELEARYPSADFSVYFRFLEACHGTVRAEDTNDHHICPRKQFPQFAEEFPENLITLKLDDHAFAHKLLAAVVPELSNVAAWIASQSAEQRTAIGKKGGAAGGLKRWLASQTAEQRKEHQAKAGSAGARAQHAAMSSEQQFEQSSRAGKIGGAKARHIQWHVKRNIVSLSCKLCTVGGTL